MKNQRRECLQQLTATSACLVCSGMFGALLSSCQPGENNLLQPAVEIIEGEPIIDLGREKSLQTVGGAAKKRFSTINNGGTVIIIIRLNSTTFAAYNAQCTHQSAEINLPVSGTLICPNHGSKFSAANGSVIQGPATMPLGKFSAIFNSEKNTITIQ